MRTPAAAAVLALLVVPGATACTGLDHPDGEPATAGRPAAEAEATSRPPQQAALGLDEPWEWKSADGGTGTTTALGYEQPVAGAASAREETGEAGHVWAVLDVRVCNEKGPSLYVSAFDWTLAYADGTRVHPSSTSHDDFAGPEFPIDTEVRAGACVRGKVVYPVRGDAWPERVSYAPGGAPEVVAEWEISAVR